MIEKIKLSEAERSLPKGILSQIRGLNSAGAGVLAGLASAFEGLSYRGEVAYADKDAVDNAIVPGIYYHGKGLYGTGNGWHGILIVLKANKYILQIDIPMNTGDHALFWRPIGNKWEKITSVTVG